ncbi:uncharacterized protein BKA78DRAFT_290786 [Phyllosticta capitalensis]|uniref:uncharacterized protein n=1 Tax=Phyllosticta capitalensis TaxID=121624 RepID=UPI0031328AD6
MIHDAKTTAGGCELLLLVCLPARLHQVLSAVHLQPVNSQPSAHDETSQSSSSTVQNSAGKSGFSARLTQKRHRRFAERQSASTPASKRTQHDNDKLNNQFASTRSTRREEKRKTISLPLHPALGFHNPICARIGILASTSSPTKPQAHAHQPTTRPSSSSTSIHPHGNLPTPAVPVCTFTSLSNPRRPRQPGRPATGYSRVWKPPQIEHAPVPSADDLPPSWIPVNCWSTYPARLLLASRNTRPSRVSCVRFSLSRTSGRLEGESGQGDTPEG